MSENIITEIDDILLRFDEMYDLTAQDIAAKIRISSVYLSRVRHGEYGEKATQSVLSKLHKLAEQYDLFEEEDPLLAQEQKAELQLARAMERNMRHPALKQAAYRRLGLDPGSMGWVSLLGGSERMDEIVIQAATGQYFARQAQRQIAQRQQIFFPQRKPAFQLPQPRTRERSQAPSRALVVQQSLNVQTSHQDQEPARVTVTEVNQNEMIQSFYGELFDHRK